ncbi:MAG: hypothetical protein KDE27_07445 [Planctomycetes bacterium]|nr:hypothetical protein [Planctomycetota bacterium]
MKTHLSFLSLLPLLAVSCGEHDHDGGFHSPHSNQPRLVSIEVEVYDPVSNGVWENVLVRVVEADNEWSGCICVSPSEQWYRTDEFGRVFLDEAILANADVGMLEDGAGRAILYPAFDQDEVTITLEVWADTFMPVFVDVPLSWDQPDVFVEVPFN